MQLHVSHDAAALYKKEMGLRDGEGLRFFVKLYGHGSVHPNYSLGVTRGTPGESTLRTTVDGITFFVEEPDEWYIGGYDLQIGVSKGEIEMALEPIKEG